MSPPEILLILFIASLTLTPTISILLDIDTILLSIYSNMDTVVFIDALYPDGFKNIGRIHVKGFGAIRLDVGGLKNAWRKELESKGRYAPITLRLVAYNKYGLADIKIIRIKHNRVIDVYLENKLTQSTSPEPSIQALSSDSVEPLIHATRVLEDSYEWNNTVLLASLVLDNTSYGVLHYYYAADFEIGFTVYLIIPTRGFGGWLSYSRSVSCNKLITPGIGENAYIWMSFEYRWEKWKTYGPGLPPEGYEEQYVYISNFYPETCNASTEKPVYVVSSRIDRVKTNAYRASSEPGQPYFAETYSGLEHRYSSIDLVSFIEALARAGKINDSLAEAITSSVSSIGVDSHIGSIPSTSIAIVVYSTIPGSRYMVGIGESRVLVPRSNYFPVYYVTTMRR